MTMARCSWPSARARSTSARRRATSCRRAASGSAAPRAGFGGGAGIPIRVGILLTTPTRSRCMSSRDW